MIHIDREVVDVFYRIFPPCGIERYMTIEREIGSGGYGVVLRCTPTRLGAQCIPGLEFGRSYAVKRLPAGGHNSRGLTEELGRSLLRVPLERHLEFFRDLRKPEVSDAGVVNFRAFIVQVPKFFFQVMELLEGPDLFDYLATRTSHIPERDAIVLVTQIVKALHYLHRRIGIVHRDVKPENIGFCHPLPPEGSGGPIPSIKLFDLGVAWVLEKVVTDESATQLHDVTMGGTPLYMAPETFNRKVGAASDVWSAGLVAYLLLGLDLPFGLLGCGDPQCQIGKEELTFCKAFDNVSPSAKTLVASMLAKSACRRATTTEILEHEWLREVAMGEDPSSSSESQLKQAQSRSAEQPHFQLKASRSRRTGDAANWQAAASMTVQMC